MTLDAFLAVLDRNPVAALHLMLPDGDFVPAHFHVTEVGRVQKDFIDCGGTVRSATACVLQVWVADDTAHRLGAVAAGNIVRIRPYWTIGQIFGSTIEDLVLSPFETLPSAAFNRKGSLACRQKSTSNSSGSVCPGILSHSVDKDFTKLSCAPASTIGVRSSFSNGRALAASPPSIIASDTP